MLIARNILDAARDKHTSFDERKHPSRTLLRALSLKERELIGAIREMNPATLMVWLTGIPLSTYDFTTGYELPENRGVEELFAITSTGAKASVKKSAPGNLASWSYPFTYHQVGNTIYLNGDATHWNVFKTLDLAYTPQAPALEDPSDELLVPDMCERYLVCYLADYMAGRAENEVSPLTKGRIRDDYVDAEKRFEADLRSLYVAKVLRKTQVR